MSPEVFNIVGSFLSFGVTFYAWPKQVLQLRKTRSARSLSPELFWLTIAINVNYGLKGLLTDDYWFMSAQLLNLIGASSVLGHILYYNHLDRSASAPVAPRLS